MGFRARWAAENCSSATRFTAAYANGRCFQWRAMRTRQEQEERQYEWRVRVMRRP
jgi:hypothetical protein